MYPKSFSSSVIFISTFAGKGISGRLMTSKASQTGQRSVHFDKRRPQTLELDLTSNSGSSSKSRKKKRQQRRQQRLKRQQRLVRAAEVEAGLVREGDDEGGGDDSSSGSEENGDGLDNRDIKDR